MDSRITLKPVFSGMKPGELTHCHGDAVRWRHDLLDVLGGYHRSVLPNLRLITGILLLPVRRNRRMSMLQLLA